VQQKRTKYAQLACQGERASPTENDVRRQNDDFALRRNINLLRRSNALDSQVRGHKDGHRERNNAAADGGLWDDRWPDVLVAISTGGEKPGGDAVDGGPDRGHT
jgi:hypothetical protein